MADGPGGREVGRISVRVLPDTSKFGVSLEKYLKRMEARLRLDIPVSLDQAGVAATEQELAILTKDRQVNIHTNVDKSQLDQLTTAVGKVTSGGGGFGGGFGGGAMLPAILAAVVTLGPVLAGTIAALPGILLTLAAPLATIMLGLEGIKGAAAGLLQPFLTLKQILANEFLAGLTPAFNMLKDVLPALTPALMAITWALSGFFAAIATALSNPANVAMLQTIFDGIAQAIWQLTPLIGPLIQLFLQFGQAFVQALVANGPTFIAAMQMVMGVFTQMVENGTIQKAITLFLLFTTAALTLVGLVVAAFTWLAAVTLDRLNAIAAWVMGLIPKFETFRAAVGQKIAAVGAFFQGLPGRIMGYLAGFPTLLVAAGSALVQGLINGIMSKVSAVTSAVSSVAQAIKDFFPGSPVKTGPLTAWNNGGAGQRLGAMLASGLTASASTVSRASLGLANAVNVPGGELAVAGARAGGGAAISVGTVVAHDYNDFTAQMDRKRRQSALRSHG